jgi:glutaredoxin 3
MAVEIVMYATGWCGFCARARALLQGKGAAFREVDTDDAESRAEMIERTGRRTVPQIFIGSRHIGGYDELRSLEQSGELDSMLKESP